MKQSILPLKTNGRVSYSLNSFFISFWPSETAVGSIPWDRDRDSANMIDESILKTRNGLYSRVTAGYINLLVHCHMHAITWKQSSFIHIKNWDEQRPTKKFLNSKLRRFCRSWLPCPFVSCYPLLIWQFHLENQENHPLTGT